MLWLIDSCQNSVSADQYAWPYRGLRYRPTAGSSVFFESIRWQVATLQMTAGSSSLPQKSRECELISGFTSLLSDLNYEFINGSFAFSPG